MVSHPRYYQLTNLHEPPADIHSPDGYRQWIASVLCGCDWAGSTDFGQNAPTIRHKTSAHFTVAALLAPTQWTILGHPKDRHHLESFPPKSGRRKAI